MAKTFAKRGHFVNIVTDLIKKDEWSNTIDTLSFIKRQDGSIDKVSLSGFSAKIGEGSVMLTQEDFCLMMKSVKEKTVEMKRGSSKELDEAYNKLTSKVLGK